MLRRLSQTAPRGARAFQKAKGETKAQKKKNAGGGRDAYAGIKQAILSEPDEELFLPSETPEEAHARKARTSRYFMQEHHMQSAALNRGAKLRQAAIEALPEALREEARQPDLTPFPVQRRVFTETAPIPGFQAEVRRTDRG
jgi:hypothetical protein